jgi:hypothetical protein
MSTKGLEFLANTIAAGFRAMKAEFRQQRTAIEQTRLAVVEYSRSVEQRDEVKGERLGKLELEVRELQRKAML